MSPTWAVVLLALLAILAVCLTVYLLSRTPRVPPHIEEVDFSLDDIVGPDDSQRSHDSRGHDGRYGHTTYRGHTDPYYAPGTSRAPDVPGYRRGHGGHHNHRPH